MTATSIYRLACDAPHCPTTTVVEDSTDTPNGWRRLASTDHLTDWKPGQRLRSQATGRTHIDKRTRWDIIAGSFTLHLCPDHTDTFDTHLPTTEGTATSARDREQRVIVACSCGQLRAYAKAIRWVSTDPEPNHDPERAWWRHLPADLREYATRGRVGNAA